MAPKVRNFSTDLTKQGGQKPALLHNAVPDIPEDTVASITASAPVKILTNNGNPRKRRYSQKTYSLLQEDIKLIDKLVAGIRQTGLYERGRSDIIQASVISFTHCHSKNR